MWMMKATPQCFNPEREREPIPIVKEAGWDPRRVWMGLENLAPSRDSIRGPSNP